MAKRSVHEKLWLLLKYSFRGFEESDRSSVSRILREVCARQGIVGVNTPGGGCGHYSFVGVDPRGRVVGFATVELRHPEEGWTFHSAVHPDHQQKGVGLQASGLAVEAAVAGGVKLIHASASDASRKICEKPGFVLANAGTAGNYHYVKKVG